MSQRRLERVAVLLREEITDIIRRSVHDPRVTGQDFTVLRVEVAADFSQARIHVSSLRPEKERDAFISGLSCAAGFIHRELMQRIRLKRIPELKFQYDDGLAQSQRIADLLAGLKRSGE